METERIKKNGWFSIEHDLIDNYAKRLKGSGFAIYCVLLSHAGGKSSCFPSKALIARKLGMSERTVYTYLKRLEALKVIRIESRGRYEDGSYRSLSYTIVDLADWREAPSANSAVGKLQQDPSAIYDISHRQELPNNKKHTNDKHIKEKGPTSREDPELVNGSPATDDTSDDEKTGGVNDNNSKGSTAPMVQLVYARFQEKIRANARLSSAAEKHIEERLKMFKAEELFTAVDNFAASEWWMEKNGYQEVEWFFEKEARISYLINMVPLVEMPPEPPGGNFNGEIFVNEMISSKEKLTRIVAYYWRRKEFIPPTYLAATSMIKRDAKDAANLVGYDEKELESAIKWVSIHCKDEKTGIVYKWNLGTVFKKIDEFRTAYGEWVASRS